MFKRNPVFSNSPYIRQQNFNFLPGHKLLLLQLPKKLEEFKNLAKHKNNKTQSTNKNAEIVEANKENNQNVVNTENIIEREHNNSATSATSIKLKITDQLFNTEYLQF